MYYVQKSGTGRLANLMFDPDEFQKAIIEMGQVLSGGKGTSKFAAYRERRAKVKHGADIVREYGRLSPVIPKDSFKAALTTLHERVYGQVSETSVEKIERDMYNSSLFGGLGFDKHAASEFTVDKGIAEDYMKQRNSLKSNDGRSE
jgi:hypothetical protein